MYIYSVLATNLHSLTVTHTLKLLTNTMTLTKYSHTRKHKLLTHSQTRWQNTATPTHMQSTTHTLIILNSNKLWFICNMVLYSLMHDRLRLYALRKWSHEFFTDNENFGMKQYLVSQWKQQKCKNNSIIIMCPFQSLITYQIWPSSCIHQSNPLNT